ncbi:unnamed protein product [Prorocentrum cordatum]|uniref:Uncharacterized protein n=1 Tax=Prorocentrum cordatum TaxID=2364126 RepID=A0ABN9V3E8_9DINO|nr:unnamed protein product [Polarella glacialis]
MRCHASGMKCRGSEARRREEEGGEGHRRGAQRRVPRNPAAAPWGREARGRPPATSPAGALRLASARGGGLWRPPGWGPGASRRPTALLGSTREWSQALGKSELCCAAAEGRAGARPQRAGRCHRTTCSDRGGPVWGNQEAPRRRCSPDFPQGAF